MGLGSVDTNWNNIDFSVLKIDFKNAFNLVFRDAVLQECKSIFLMCLTLFCASYGSVELTIRHTAKRPTRSFSFRFGCTQRAGTGY